MKLNQGWAISVFLAMSGFAMPILAEFGVRGSDLSTDGCGTIENTDYGNAQTVRFHNAISGTSCLTKEERDRLGNLLPLNETGHFYGRFRLAFSTAVLDEIRNRSSGVDSNATVNVKHVSDARTAFEIAVGYFFSSNFRGDLEYLANKNFTYNANPLFTNGPVSRSLTAEIKSNTLLANLYYEFTGVYRFRPYLTGGIGLSNISVTSSVTPTPVGATTPAPQNPKKGGIAWSAGLGLRINIFKRWSLDMGYRYIRLGSGINIKPNSDTKLISNYSVNNMSLGFIYLF